MFNMAFTLLLGVQSDKTPHHRDIYKGKLKWEMNQTSAAVSNLSISG